MVRNFNSTLILSALCFSPWVLGAYLPDKTCKAYPGTSNWPSKSKWNQLNETLSGRLLQPPPPGAVCHEGWPTYDPAECPVVANNWSVYEFHCDNPISVMWNQFSNDTCLPDSEDPCSAEGYPAYVVNATTPEHVKAGIDYARQHNIRLVIKSTGHDFLGRSIAPGSLSIWTHHMDTIVVHKDGFYLEGSSIAIPGIAVTVGAGAQMWDIYSTTAALNQTIVGGGGKTVGISGYITGGGHSILAPRYGLAADQVLQMEMVTPGGEIITINECQHSDLFWAMRGGGGSTFGALTSITIKTHPSPQLLSSQWMILTDADEPFALDVISYVLSQFPALDAAGLSGYAFLAPRYPNPVPSPGAPKEVAGVLGVFMLQDTVDPEDAEKVWAPLNATIQEKWSGAVQMYQAATPFDSFFDWFSVHYDTGSAGNDSYLVSRLLDEEALTSKDLGEALKAASVPAGGVGAYLVSGKGVHDAKPRGGSDAVNPAWRKAFIHSLSGQGFPPLNHTAKIETIKALNNSFEPLREISPSSGAYINEALPFEHDWQHTFWGDNYERLHHIKRSVDPYDVFWCFPCVGNERWEERNDGRLCKTK